MLRIQSLEPRKDDSAAVLSAGKSTTLPKCKSSALTGGNLRGQAQIKPTLDAATSRPGNCADRPPRGVSSTPEMEISVDGDSLASKPQTVGSAGGGMRRSPHIIDGDTLLAGSDVIRAARQSLEGKPQSFAPVHKRRSLVENESPVLPASMIPGNADAKLVTRLASVSGHEQRSDINWLLPVDMQRNQSGNSGISGVLTANARNFITPPPLPPAGLSAHSECDSAATVTSSYHRSTVGQSSSVQDDQHGTAVRGARTGVSRVVPPPSLLPGHALGVDPAALSNQTSSAPAVSLLPGREFVTMMEYVPVPEIAQRVVAQIRDHESESREAGIRANDTDEKDGGAGFTVPKTLMSDTEIDLASLRDAAGLSGRTDVVVPLIQLQKGMQLPPTELPPRFFQEKIVPLGICSESNGYGVAAKKLAESEPSGDHPHWDSKARQWKV